MTEGSSLDQAIALMIGTVSLSTSLSMPIATGTTSAVWVAINSVWSGTMSLTAEGNRPRRSPMMPMLKVGAVLFAATACGVFLCQFG